MHREWSTGFVKHLRLWRTLSVLEIYLENDWGLWWKIVLIIFDCIDEISEPECPRDILKLVIACPPDRSNPGDRSGIRIFIDLEHIRGTGPFREFRFYVSIKDIETVRLDEYNISNDWAKLFLILNWLSLGASFHPNFIVEVVIYRVIEICEPVIISCGQRENIVPLARETCVNEFEAFSILYQANRICGGVLIVGIRQGKKFLIVIFACLIAYCHLRIVFIELCIFLSKY